MENISVKLNDNSYNNKKTEITKSSKYLVAKLNILYGIFILLLFVENNYVKYIITNSILKQIIPQIITIGIPAIIMVLFIKNKNQSLKSFIRFNKVNLSIIITSMFTMLFMVPVFMVVNSILSKLIPSSNLDYSKIFEVPIYLQIISIAILPGICEEILFRGVLVRSAEGVSRKFAIIYVALVFSLAHLSASKLLPTFIVGVFSGYLSIKTNSIIPSIVVHITNNMIPIGYMAIGSMFSADYSAQPKGWQVLELVDIT